MTKRKYERVGLLTRFTTMESLVSAMVIRGESYAQIGKRLGIKRSTVNFHAKNAARKIPGDDILKPRTKLQFWARGARIDQLMGDGWMPTNPTQ
jgi:DNA-binding CsgD family transcriptional regulator